MKKIKNPFLLTGYYGNKYFCDREEELNMLESHFGNERNVVLYSWRRMGKTALIQRLLAGFEKSKMAETLYIDLLGTRDVATAVKQITLGVHDRFGRSSGGLTSAFQRLMGNLGIEMGFDPVTGMPSLSLGYKNRDLPERSLHAIGDFLENRRKKIVIALDEFQQISNYTESNGEAVFRSWMQNFSGIRFIFSGSHRGLMTSMFAEKNRPFYRSAQLIPLDPIDSERYEKFINGHFAAAKKSIGSESIFEIYRWSRGQTYCIQLICNKLYGSCDKAGKADVEIVCREILNQESAIFSNYTNLLTATQWKVIQAIACEEPLVNPLSRDFIDKYHLGATSSVSTALNMLNDSELVIREGNAYYVHDVLLARWLQGL